MLITRSGAGTNLKMGRTRYPVQSDGENLLLSCPSTFFASTSTISRFGERFRDGQYSLVSFLFAVLLLTVPRAQPFVKVGAHAPPRSLWSRRH